MKTSELHQVRSIQLSSLLYHSPAMTMVDHGHMLNVCKQAKMGVDGAFSIDALSDKELELVDFLAGKYLEKVA